MADYLPLYYPGQVITRVCAADVRGGRVVRVAGSGTVAEAGAGAADWLGVAAYDAKSGEPVTVWTDGVQRCIASGPITAGANVLTGATGTVAAGAAAVGTTVGIALSTAADTALVEVKFLR